MSPPPRKTKKKDAPVSQILQQIEAGKAAGVYYLAGERYPQQLVLDALRAAILQGQQDAFNYELLHAKEDGISAILSAIRTMPMLGGQRLVVVREAQLLKSKDHERLLPYVERPSPGACLVLTADKADTRLKFFKQVAKHGVLFKGAPLRDRDVAGWVTDEARRQGITLKAGAAERVAASVGTDMGQLAMALEQLSIYVGGADQAVTTRAVEELLAQTREHSIFELTNAVGRGQRQEALRVLRRMLEAREPGVKILVMLVRHVRLLWSARELSAGGMPSKQVASQIGVHPFFVQDMIRQADRIGQRTLRRMHRSLFEADRAIKSSRLQDAMVLERLVLSLCPAS